MAHFPRTTTLFGSLGTPLICPVCLILFTQIRVEISITAQTLPPADGAHPHTVEVLRLAEDQVTFAEPCGHQVLPVVGDPE